MVVKWFVEEEQSLEARRYLVSRARRQSTLLAPDLIMYEVANALRFSRAFSSEDVTLAMDYLADLGLELIEPMPQLINGAAQLAEKYNISVYDASYAFLAQFLHVPLITADIKLANKLKPLRIVKVI